MTLTNHLFKPIYQDSHPEVPVNAPFSPSNRVSLHAHLLKYDMLGSDGATVGFNPDQTIAPGESITYRWFADTDLGAVELGMWGILRIYDKLEIDLVAINGNDKFWQCFDWKHKIFMNMIKL